MGLRVRAVVLYEWQCPKCKGWFQEGNPLECPHQEGRGVKYKPQKDGKVINAQVGMRKLRLEERPEWKPEPVTKPDKPSGSALVFTSVQEIVDLQCRKGT